MDTNNNERLNNERLFSKDTEIVNLNTKNAFTNLSGNGTGGFEKSYERPVICLNTKQTFDSIIEASKFYKINSTINIRKSCIEVNRSCGKHPNTGEKLYWAFLEDYENGHRTTIPPKKKRLDPVICLNTKEKFEDIFAAAQFYNIKTPGNIRKSCKYGVSSGKHPLTYEKLYWAYLKDYESGTKTGAPINFIKNNRDNIKRGRENREIICIPIKQVYDNEIQMINRLGLLSDVDIPEACTNGISIGVHPNTGEKLYCAYLDDYVANKTKILKRLKRQG